MFCQRKWKNLFCQTYAARETERTGLWSPDVPISLMFTVGIHIWKWSGLEWISLRSRLRNRNKKVIQTYQRKRKLFLLIRPWIWRQKTSCVEVEELGHHSKLLCKWASQVLNLKLLIWESDSYIRTNQLRWMLRWIGRYGVIGEIKFVYDHNCKQNHIKQITWDDWNSHNHNWPPIRPQLG